MAKRASRLQIDFKNDPEYQEDARLHPKPPPVQNDRPEVNVSGGSNRWYSGGEIPKNLPVKVDWDYKNPQKDPFIIHSLDGKHNFYRNDSNGNPIKTEEQWEAEQAKKNGIAMLQQYGLIAGGVLVGLIVLGKIL